MLSIFDNVYGRIIGARNRLYDRGSFAERDLGAYTISIGNITAGGTGKTPLTIFVAEILAERGEKVCVLTRGYGRKNPRSRVLVSDGSAVLTDAKTGGDEPLEMANKLLEKAIVVADSDRVSAADWARNEFGVTAFVLDDGFQHRRAKRDLDIVCIDATDPFGGGKMLPSGRLREPLHNLRRADALIITRSDLVDSVKDLRNELTRLSPAAAIFTAANRIAKITRLGGNQTIAEIGPEPSAAFCGIGNPENFFSLLRLNGAKITTTESFRDHHAYTQTDIDRIIRTARLGNADRIFTTAKDSVKLGGLLLEMPLYIVEIETIIDDEDGFRKLI